MATLLDAMDHSTTTPTTPASASNHLNLVFAFEQSTSPPLGILDGQAPFGHSILEDALKTERDATTDNSLGLVTPRNRHVGHLHRPSTAPALGSTSTDLNPDFATRRRLDLPQGLTGARSHADGRDGERIPKWRIPARPFTAPSGNSTLKGLPGSPRSRHTPQAYPPSSFQKDGSPHLLSPASGSLTLSRMTVDTVVSDRTMDQSADSAQLRLSMMSPAAGDQSATVSLPRPPPARRMSSMSLGGGVHHSSSSGSSMDFMKFMPLSTTTTSPRSASFSNTIGKASSPVDVKRLLSKPATPAGFHSASNPIRPDDISGNVLPSPTAPQFAPEDPSSEIRARQPFQRRFTPPSLEPRARPKTAATHEEKVCLQADSPPRPSTSVSAVVGRATKVDGPSPRTYTSPGEGIGESPQPKQKLERSSSSRPPHNRRTSFAKTDGYLSETSAVRLPKVSTALTPASAIALAYRSQSVTGHREARTPDVKVAPWESDTDLPIGPAGAAAPSEWGDLCTPSGFRRLGRKLSMKLSGDERPPTPQQSGRSEPRARTRSFDRPRPRASEVARKASFDAKRPPLPRPTKASQPAERVRETKEPPTPPPPVQPQAAAEQKRRPSFGDHLGGFMRKMSNGNLRGAKKDAEQTPPVPRLPPTPLKDKAILETPSGKTKPVKIPPVPPIPIHLIKGSPSSTEDPNQDDSAVYSATSSVESFVAFPSTGSPYTPGNSPPYHSSNNKQPPIGKQAVSDLPYTQDTRASPSSQPALPERSSRRPKGNTQKEELPPLAPTKQKEPTVTTVTTIPSTSSDALQSDAEIEHARRRAIPKPKRDKTSKLSISIVDAPSKTSRSPTFGASTPKAAAGPSPGPAPREDSIPVRSKSSSSKSPNPAADRPFPPPRSASLNTPSPSSSSRPVPTPSPHSAHSTPAVAFRPLRSNSNKAPLSEKQKAELWDELLKKSEEAGGTLQLHATQP